MNNKDNKNKIDKIDGVEDDKLSLKDIAGSMAIALVLVAVFNFFFTFTRVSGYSMYPTLDDREHLIFTRLPVYKKDFKRGDVVVFRMEDGVFFVKRVIGLPNDRVVITDGDVFVNDEKLKEDYIKEPYTIGEMDVVVPEDSLFVLGDNRQNSNDSRFPSVGFIPFNRVKAIKRNL